MSGGIDSSVSAWCLKKQGYYIEGLFMKNWEENNNEKYCTYINDLNDVKSICNKLNIILHIINFSDEYWNNVFKFFIKGYKIGCTPNPDILCNKEIKFKLFLKFAIKELNADYIATGHYIRLGNYNNKFFLLRGLDKNKDQSYFLYILNYKKLLRCLFPIGNLTKSEVRYIAMKLNLFNFNKKDSIGICFIGKRKFIKFITSYLYQKPGIIITIKGKKIGKHKGVAYYTIGQRKGLNIGGISNTYASPWYIINKNITKNQLIVSQNKKLIFKKFIVSDVNWIEPNLIKKNLNCTVKTKYRQLDINCNLKLTFNNQLIVKLTKPIFAIAPGQSAVFYILERCIGGGIIKKIFLNNFF